MIFDVTDEYTIFNPDYKHLDLSYLNKLADLIESKP